MELDRIDQAVLVLAADVTPPAVWNALGPTGWVPTVEMTVHLRAAPGRGPLRIDALTSTVTGGFLEEDAWVYGPDGVLLAQSRQLALWSAAA